MSGVEEKVAQFEDTLISIMDKFMPLKTKTFTIRPDTEWFNDEIRDAKHCRRKLERKCRRTGLEIDRQIHKEAKTKTKMLIVKAKQNHVKSKIEENKNNPKQLHRIMNGLMRQSNAVAPLPSCQNLQELAERFSQFF